MTDETPRRGRGKDAIVVILLAFGIMGTAFGVSALLTTWHYRPPADMQTRVATLMRALGDSVLVIGQIEAEIQERQQLVARLKQDAETAQALATLSQAQAEAVAQGVRAELQRRERETFWWTLLNSLFFTVLGIVLDRIWERFRSRRSNPASASTNGASQTTRLR